MANRDRNQHPVWATWLLCAGAVLLALAAIAVGPPSGRTTPLSRQAPALAAVATSSPALPGGSEVQARRDRVGDSFFEPSSLAIQPEEARPVLSNEASRRHTWHLHDRIAAVDLLRIELPARQE